ncbi:FecCD family ABC transporter permease [Limisalsivibrio acetivorans]|uniref:FecCD family ABC transporter permease n=1 Tax=Limisalsivibrio acetivorans TaxID=1304888 RepID=UPI00040E65A8|nr:iron ABC transporter permease [Limisalsivibrio acetivorans]
MSGSSAKTGGITPTRLTILFLILSALSFAGCWLALSFGGEFIPPHRIADGGIIISKLRVPRIMADFMVGGGLSIVGLAFQTYFRNPLAEPFTLGISGGAAVGVVLAMLIGAEFIFARQIFSFAFAALTVFAVYGFSGRFRSFSPSTLILGGVGLNFLFSAVISLVNSVMSEHFTKNLVLWYMGDTTLVGFNSAVISLIAVSLLSLLLYLDSARLNIYTLGDETAVNSGISVTSLGKRIFLTGSAITAISVSLCGSIGFVGIVVPHIIKRFTGGDHRISMPFAFFMGGLFVAVTDTFFKTVFFPVEVPVGAVTALIGAPVFIRVLRREVL